MTIEEIKSAVLAGKRVYWHHTGYEVICDSIGQWLIVCKMNGHCTGLTREYESEPMFISENAQL